MTFKEKYEHRQLLVRAFSENEDCLTKLGLENLAKWRFWLKVKESKYINSLKS